MKQFIQYAASHPFKTLFESFPYIVMGVLICQWFERLIGRWTRKRKGQQ
jgi:hypothetical protein